MGRSEEQEVCVGVIDVGSPKSGNLGWAIRKTGNRAYGEDLDQFIAEFAQLCDGCPAAIGFEAPLFVPIRDEVLELTNARNGEGSRPWSASAGATVLAVGLPIMTYTLNKLRSKINTYEATLDWKDWNKSDRSLLVWEAFVSGSSKSNDHWKDADNAVIDFLDNLNDLVSANAIVETNVLSLVGAALIHSGWMSPSAETLKYPALVIKPLSRKQ